MILVSKIIFGYLRYHVKHFFKMIYLIICYAGHDVVHSAFSHNISPYFNFVTTISFAERLIKRNKYNFFLGQFLKIISDSDSFIFQCHPLKHFSYIVNSLFFLTSDVYSLLFTILYVILNMNKFEMINTNLPVNTFGKKLVWEILDAIKIRTLSRMIIDCHGYTSFKWFP